MTIHRSFLFDLHLDYQIQKPLLFVIRILLNIKKQS